MLISTDSADYEISSEISDCFTKIPQFPSGHKYRTLTNNAVWTVPLHINSNTHLDFCYIWHLLAKTNWHFQGSESFGPAKITWLSGSHPSADHSLSMNNHVCLQYSSTHVMLNTSRFGEGSFATDLSQFIIVIIRCG